MACLEESFHPRQHHALAVAAEIARAQSGREHLAIHARQLALEPRIQILRRHPRPLLLRLEQAHRHALEDHLHRDQRLGLPVMIIKTWYYSHARAPACGASPTRLLCRPWKPSRSRLRRSVFLCARRRPFFQDRARLLQRGHDRASARQAGGESARRPCARASPRRGKSRKSGGSSARPKRHRRKRTKAVRSGVAPSREKPQKRRKLVRSESASASITSERSYQVASNSALNIERGGQAFSPLGAG